MNDYIAVEIKTEKLNDMYATVCILLSQTQDGQARKELTVLRDKLALAHNASRIYVDDASIAHYNALLEEAHEAVERISAENAPD